MEQVRRVITGEEGDGRSRIVAIDHVESVAIAGIRLFPLWGVPSLPVPLPTTGLEDPGDAKGAGIVRTAIGVLPAKQLVGGSDSHLNFDEEGFHRTDSVDVAYVISGSVLLRVPGEPDTMLNAGDCIVQNGALHAWLNQGDEDAVILWVWVKGERAA
jgi:hypothetical protein